METALGHLNQDRKNQCSANNVIIKQEKKQFIKIVTPKKEGKLYTDQTGQFPTTSNRGYKYILILYDQDSNSILEELLK